MNVASVKEILKDKKKVRYVAESAFKQVDKDGIYNCRLLIFL
jgi:calmodulin